MLQADESAGEINHFYVCFLSCGKWWFAGLGKQKAWAMKREMLASAYTTRLSDLPVAK